MLALTNAKAQESVREHNERIEAYQKRVHRRNGRIYHARLRRSEAHQEAYQSAVHRRNARIRHQQLLDHGHGN